MKYSYIFFAAGNIPCRFSCCKACDSQSKPAQEIGTCVGRCELFGKHLLQLFQRNSCYLRRIVVYYIILLYTKNIDGCGTGEMTDREILETALRQSAADLNASPEDFTKNENVIVREGLGPLARKYYKEPIACNLVSYGSNIVASVRDEYREIIREYLEKFTFYHCFETPDIHWLDDRLAQFGQRVCFMAEYFLPDTAALKPLSCDFELKTLTKKDFSGLYLPEWSNALCAERSELDVLGVGAYDGDKLVGFAACSADCDSMWQIGVDVLPEYRRRGIASAVTSKLAVLILERNIVPFYCCAWSNIPSARNAIRSGFRPAWAEMTVKPKEIVDGFIG